jgi:NADH-quinone oxidoreductase subunit M
LDWFTFSFIGVAWLLAQKPADARRRPCGGVADDPGRPADGAGGAVDYRPEAGLVTVVDQPWIPQLGIRFHFAVDGISVVLVILTGLAAVAGVLFS